MKSFEETILEQVSDPASQLQYLIDMCVGTAHEVIKSCHVISPPSAGLKQAVDLLYENFGQKHIVVDAQLNCICNGPPIKSDKESLSKLATELMNCQIIMEAWGFGSFLNSPQTLASVFKRLPIHLQRMFCNKVEITGDGHIASFVELLNFIKHAAQRTNTFFGKIVADLESNKRPKRQIQNSQKVFSTQVKTVENSNAAANRTAVLCIAYHNNHPLFKCEVFQKKSVPERWKLLAGKKVCYNCLRPNHFSRECKSTKKCSACGRSHHSLLHNEDVSNLNCNKPANENRVAPELPTDSSVSCVSVPATSHSVSKIVRLMVVPVRVYGNNENHFVDTYAFLDGGSNISLCTKRLMNRLNLKGVETTEKIIGMTGSKIEKGFVVPLNIKGLSEKTLISVPSVMAIDELPNLSSSIPTDKTASQYDHLKGLRFPKVAHNDVEILIGADVWQAYAIRKVLEGSHDEPRALQTGLGWTLFGPDKGVKFANALSVNFTHCSDDMLHEQMKKMFNYEFSDCNYASDDLSYSVEDKLFLKKANNSITKVKDHYQLALPWKTDDLVLPLNRAMAEKRLNYLKIKFEKNGGLFACYKEKIDDLLKNGYARKVPEECGPTPGRTWYIPHHSCCTSGKFRVVHDCAARFGGISLNDCLLSGPDMTNSLIGVLLRFRLGKFAFTADIKSMFLQVYVDPKDWDALRFLWWPDNDLTLPPADSSVADSSAALGYVLSKSRTATVSASDSLPGSDESPSRKCAAKSAGVCSNSRPADSAASPA